jgi:hypothetical protein
VSAPERIEQNRSVCASSLACRLRIRPVRGDSACWWLADDPGSAAANHAITMLETNILTFASNHLVAERHARRT